MIVAFQIVINNGFYCRKSYHLLKRHQNSTLSAISRRDIITPGAPCTSVLPHALINSTLLQVIFHQFQNDPNTVDNHVPSSDFNRLNHTEDLLLSRNRREVS
jgi:hypothetical protein